MNAGTEYTGILNHETRLYASFPARKYRCRAAPIHKKRQALEDFAGERDGLMGNVRFNYLF
ncbi:MAG: hypothetical protein GX776_07345 [Oxalobacter sp.]|nr:hypothetical protein [Oxalobacter sp.]